jgi:hypothetical protein
MDIIRVALMMCPIFADAVQYFSTIFHAHRQQNVAEKQPDIKLCVRFFFYHAVVIVPQLQHDGSHRLFLWAASCQATGLSAAALLTQQRQWQQRQQQCQCQQRS